MNVKLPSHTEMVVVLLNLYVIYNTQHSRKYVIELLLCCGFLQGKDYNYSSFFLFRFFILSPHPPPIFYYSPLTNHYNTVLGVTVQSVNIVVTCSFYNAVNS